MNTMLQQTPGSSVFRLMILAAMVFAVGTAQAQTQATTFDFEDQELGNWYFHTEAAHNYSTSGEITDARSYNGEYSVRVTVGNDGQNAALANQNLQVLPGDTIRYRVYIPADQVADINAIQPFLLHGEGWTWADGWFSAANLDADEWNVIEYVVPAGAGVTQRVGLQITGHSATGTGTVYVDYITINEHLAQDTSPATQLVTLWGFQSGADADWEMEDSGPGHVTVGGLFPPAGWMALRGEFNDVEPEVGESVIVSGTLELIGGGLAVDGFNGSSSLRWGVYSGDAGELQNDEWATGGGGHYGYLFTPPSGIVEELVWWQGVGPRFEEGSHGTVGGIVDRTWYSTNGGNDYVLSDNRPSPPHAAAGEGTYEFAFSFTRLEDGETEIRYYLIKDDGMYYFAGEVVDDVVWGEGDNEGEFKGPRSFNTFALALGLSAPATSLSLSGVTVTLAAEPLVIPEYETPEPPMPPHEIGAQLNVGGSFEFHDIGAITGSGSFWSFNLTPSEAQGEAEIVHDEERGRVLQISVGEWNEMPDDWHVEAVNEPFYPQAGDRIEATVWLRADTDDRVARIYLGLPASGNWARYPSGGQGGGGVTVELSTEWQQFSIIHTATSTDETNSMRFGMALNAEANDDAVIEISDVRVVKLEPATSSDPEEMARSFALAQNYPNPFNPVTTINFEMGITSHVSIAVYNSLGQRVTTLVDGVRSTGVHQVQFNANDLPSGIYFYQMRTEGQVVTRQMVLLK